MKAHFHPFAGLVVLLSLGTFSSAQNAPELGRVPESAALIVHGRIKNLWSSPSLKVYRDFLDKAGPKAMETLQKRFQITPFDIDRVTVVVGFPGPDRMGNEPDFAFLIATTKDIASEGLAEKLEIPAVEVKGASVPTWENKDMQLGLALPKPRLAVIGKWTMVEQITKGKDGLAPTVFREIGENDLTLIVDLTRIPEALKKDIPPEAASIVQAKKIHATFDLDGKNPLVLKFDFPTENGAIDAEKTIRGFASYLLESIAAPREQFNNMLEKPGSPRPSPYSELGEAAAALYGLATLADYQEMLRNPPLKRTGSSLVAKLENQLGASQTQLFVTGVTIGMLVPAVQKVRQAANRMNSANNLKQIALACHGYHDVNGYFPGDITDKKTGKPILSWRVAILPYLEEDALYREFHLDEPWDSTHNIKLAARVVKVYSTPELPMNEGGPFKTPYQGFSGPKALFEKGKKVTLAKVTDGSSQTVLAVESKNLVVWSKPEDISFDPEKDLPPLQSLVGGLNPVSFHVLFCDGSVKKFPYTLSPKVVKSMVTINGGEEIPNSDN